MGLVVWSFADHCKKVIIWTTRLIADLLNEFSAEARRKLLRAEGRTPCRTYVGKLLANPEQFGETKPGEVILVASYLWMCICCARSMSGMCLFSVTPDMLPEWVGSSLPGFHIPSLFPNGSPTLWHSDMVTDFFLLITPIIKLEAPPYGIHILTLVSRWTEYELPQVCQNALPTCVFLPAQSQLQP